MKKLISSSLLLFLFSSNAMVGSSQAVEAYLDDEFRSISNVSELNFLGQTESCDEVADTYVVGSISSNETAYTCTICLINDGGVATVDSQESFCNRQ